MRLSQRLRERVTPLGAAAALFLLVAAEGNVSAQDLPADMAAGWRAYIAENDRQIAAADASSDAFLAQEVYVDDPLASEAREAVRRGEVFVTKITLTRQERFPLEVPNALVHHWIGTVKVPGVTLDEVLNFVQDFEAYPRYFDEVDSARVLERTGDAFRVQLKTHRSQVITVHYNTVHNIQFERHAPRRASQRATTERIAELENVGQTDEREKAFGEDNGFLWRLHSNWRYEEKDDGVVVEAEIVSLSRRVPFGFGWLVGGFVESVPQETLTETLEKIAQFPQAVALNPVR